MKTDLNSLTPKRRHALWPRLRAKLKKRFEAANVVTCELRLTGCWFNNALSFAHSRKRRHISTTQLLEEVILACTPCHQRIEILGEERMHEIVIEVIEKRNEQIGINS